MTTCADCWPIEPNACALPPGWGGWPGHKRFALVLTHDVEGQRGFGRVRQLLAMEEKRGFTSSFNFVPKKYRVDQLTLEFLRSRGFEVGVHGWKHDGKLYASHAKFQRRARKINRCLKDWTRPGSAPPRCTTTWIGCTSWKSTTTCPPSTPIPFEPQPDGVCTIFPFWVAAPKAGAGYVEMPYTLPQDSTLFVLMGRGDIDIWKRKLRWIADIGGMALVNTHPDYMRFDPGRRGADEYDPSLYEAFLTHVSQEYAGRYWNALPQEVAAFWRTHMSTVPSGTHLQKAI